MKPAILIAASGARSEAHRLLEAELREAFPGHEVAWACPSRPMAARFGIPSLTEAFAGLRSRGVQQAVLLSLHLAPGEQHQTVLSETHQGLELVHAGPLLASEEDLEWMAKGLGAEMPLDCPVLLVAHGHPGGPRCDDPLPALAERLSERHPLIHLAWLKGNGDAGPLEDFIRQARTQGRVHVEPLLLGAGSHLAKDILGAEPESFKARVDVPDFTCGSVLGERAWVRRRIVEQIRAALKGFLNISD